MSRLIQVISDIVMASTEGALYKYNDHFEFFEGVGVGSNPPSEPFFHLEFSTVTFYTILVAI